MAIYWTVSALDSIHLSEAVVWPFIGQYQPKIVFIWSDADVWPFIGHYQP